MIGVHHGVFIATPEYNASITPLLKNTLDWISRVREATSRRSPPIAIASSRSAPPPTGRYGGYRSLIALRQVLELGCGALVLPEQIAVREAANAFDEMDNLREERAQPTVLAAVLPAGRVAHRHSLVNRAEMRRTTLDAPMLDPRDRLIVALDLPSVAEAEAMVARLGDAVRSTRSAISSPMPAGSRSPKRWSATGKQVFLDLKLHDIGNTVAKGVESIARLGATFLTVHAYPQTMKRGGRRRAAIAACAFSPSPC